MGLEARDVGLDTCEIGRDTRHICFDRGGTALNLALQEIVLVRLGFNITSEGGESLVAIEYQALQTGDPASRYYDLLRIS